MKKLCFLLTIMLLCQCFAAGAASPAQASEILFDAEDFEVLCSAQDENGNLCIGGRTKMPKGRLICVDTTGNLLWSVENDLPGGDWYSSIVPCGDGRYMALHQQYDSSFTHHLEMIEQGQVVQTTHLPDEQAFSLYPAEDGVLLLTGTAIDATSLSKWSYDGEQLWKLDFGKGYRFYEVLTLQEGYLGIGYYLPDHSAAWVAAVCLIDKDGRSVQEYFSKKDSQWVDAAIHNGKLYLFGQIEHEELFKGIVAANASSEGMEPVIYIPDTPGELTPFSLVPMDGGFLTASVQWNQWIPTALTLTRFNAKCQVVGTFTCPMADLHAICDCWLFSKNGQAFALVCGTVEGSFQFVARLVQIPLGEGSAR
ncbi:MAG: hypothetical protein J6K73_09735 [Clostridia bacterium]|nr:hypothetical protein [Clostridia bacterium]